MQPSSPDSLHNNKKSSIWPLAWISFFWSTASLMVIATLPIFLSEELKISNKHLGLLEGIAIASAFLSKIIAGFISDYWQKRRLLLLLGGSLTVLSKPLFALAYTPLTMFYARFIDRVSKGLRSAPMEAMISLNSDTQAFNYSFGLRQTLYACGAALGALIAMCSMHYLRHQLRLIFIIACIPATIALLLLIFTTRDIQLAGKHKPQLLTLYHLSKPLWLILMFVGVLTCARFSEMFMFFKARALAWPMYYIPIMIIIIDCCQSLSAYYCKTYADVSGEYRFLMFSFACLLVANLLFIWSSSKLHIILGCICNGIHLGFSQSPLRALIAKNSLPQQVGTAFALFHFISALAVLVANCCAGFSTEHFGSSACFVYGLIPTVLATVILTSYKFQGTVS
jgi:MFS family permease